MEEAQNELSSLERQSKHRMDEMETRYNSLQASVNEIQTELAAKSSALQSTQHKLSLKEADVGKLESEVIHLKGQSGDSDSLVVIKNQLSEQVAHIKQLEVTNRAQSAELQKYRKVQKSVEIVEEEKRALESKVLMMKDLQRELGEAQLRKQALEDERTAWATYLEAEASSHGAVQFESPEELARAFIKERLETASLLDQLGKIQPELTVKEEAIASLEAERTTLRAELEKARTVASAPVVDTSKARNRLERQRALAIKEVEYLRAQLKNFDMEEEEEKPDHFDGKKAERIKELESLVDQYRNEIQTVQAELKAAEDAASKSASAAPAATPSSPKKRALEDPSESDERVGTLIRKNRKLEEALREAQKQIALLEADFKAAKTQLSNFKSSSRYRILELRNNPTASFENLKLGTIRTLREENAALLDRLKGNKPDDLTSVPTSSLLAAKAEMAELTSTIASHEKKQLRLKQIWSSKSLEFRDAVASLLGWKLDFMPNGRVRVTSMFYPGDEETGENSIVFDAEKGTMKVSGGERSKFAEEIRDLIVYWVEGRKTIPGFLAAMTLEFWERENAKEEEEGGS